MNISFVYGEEVRAGETQISPHYRSVGRRQGSSGVFGGSWSLSFGAVSPFYPVHFIHGEDRLFFQKINPAMIKILVR